MYVLELGEKDPTVVWSLKSGYHLKCTFLFYAGIVVVQYLKKKKKLKKHLYRLQVKTRERTKDVIKKITKNLLG